MILSPNEAITWRELSVEPSSTTMISNFTPVCEVSDLRQPSRLDSSLRAGIMIETSGIAVEDLESLRIPATEIGG